MRTSFSSQARVALKSLRLREQEKCRVEVWRNHRAIEAPRACRASRRTRKAESARKRRSVGRRELAVRRIVPSGRRGRIGKSVPSLGGNVPSAGYHLGAEAPPAADVQPAAANAR